MKRYNPKEIEPKWQKIWEESGIYQATENPDKPNKYILEYFPYPSGNAMHVGHVRNYAIGDAMARFARMRGENVLHPMGWDAFGLPAENYAIKTGISPQQAIAENTTKFKQQLTQMGFSYDWTREINSSDPKYYRWTQWFFNLLFKRGLAYQKESLQWWCDTDKTVLANEQVEAGKCWRCGNEVVKKPLKQWFFKITDYADRLADDLDNVDWSDALKSMQRNWIGKSTGAEVSFALADDVHPDDIDVIPRSIMVFTTRPDTLYGATFMVLAPEHPLVSEITTDEQRAAVDAYIKDAQKKSDVERQETNREKTGVFTGAYAINPINDEKIPVWIADYVLTGYGTGAIMAVPAHDERDYEFAQKFELPIREVVKPQDATDVPEGSCFAGEGIMANSAKYDGIASSDAREKIVADLAASGKGHERVNYRIRDWLISRQRYWGAPIPIIQCPHCGPVPVPDEQLPVVLPELKSYEPSGDGRSPLARVPEFVNVKCPECGGDAERETDTMDGFACSSWYFLRFADPHNEDQPFDAAKAKFWLPVDSYIGGAEHAVMHLLYARMWTKVMSDAGLIDFDEPFMALRNQGMILAPDGQKMSKSKGNVIAPDELIDQGYGADSIRLMELFIGPWNQEAAWSVEGMGGVFRFLQRTWALTQEYIASPHAETHAVKAVATIDPEEIADEPAVDAGGVPVADDHTEFEAPVPENTEAIEPAVKAAQLASAGINKMAKAVSTAVLGTANAAEEAAEAAVEPLDPAAKDLVVLTHKTIKRVSADMEDMGFNTAIAALMEYVNGLYKLKVGGFERQEWHFAIETLLKLLAPFAPHITEELWQQLGHEDSIHISLWPLWNETYLVEDTFVIAVQVNGKVRGTIQIAASASEEEIIEYAKAEENVRKHTDGKDIKKTIYIKGKLVSIVAA